MERKVHFSRKRAAILEMLQKATCHPSADWVFNQLKHQYPGLSLGTVYRNLHAFCQSGQAVSLGVVDGHERFDGQLAPHAHLVCACCGAVIDVFGALPDQVSLDALSQETGCKIDGVSVIFQGVCPACLEGNQSKTFLDD